MLRISRTEGEALSAIDDGSSKAECNRGNAVGKIHRGDRVEVPGTNNAGEVGIETLIVCGADDLLDDHRHLFFFEAIGRGADVSFCVLAEGRGINTLDRLGQSIQSFLIRNAGWRA